MVRIALASDVHVEHHPEVVSLLAERFSELAPDVVVVAGDVCSNLHGLQNALGAWKERVPHLTFVAGNHDLWCAGDSGMKRGGEPNSRERYLSAIPELCERVGAHCLHTAPLILPGLNIVGQTGWYDYSLRSSNPAIPMSAYIEGSFDTLGWADKHFVTWPSEDGRKPRLSDDELCQWMTDRLNAQLRMVPKNSPTLGVTHMLPFASLISREPPLPWAFVLGFLGAKRLGQAFLAAKEQGVNLFGTVCGHTHFRLATQIDTKQGSFWARTSPLGYPREYRPASLAERIADRVMVFTPETP